MDFLFQRSTAYVRIKSTLFRRKQSAVGNVSWMREVPVKGTPNTFKNVLGTDADLLEFQFQQELTNYEANYE